MFPEPLPGDRSPLATFSRGRFGGPTFLRERLLTVATTLTVIFQNNPARVMWYMENFSLEIVRFGFDQNPTSSNGFRLDPDGGFASMLVEEDGEAVGYQVNGIGTGSANVRLLEVIRL